MNHNATKISVVIPVRNEGERIKNCITSFCTGRSVLFPIEFIIVDDASDDGCCNKLEALFNSDELQISIKLIRLTCWSGIPFARNTGAENATAPILVITDANVETERGWDIPVLREIRPDLALCATITDINSSWKAYGCTLDLPGMGIQWLGQSFADNYIPIAPCTGTVISKQLFLAVGGYDVAMPAYGAAEPEFSLRLWLYGARIKNVPGLVFRHRFRPAEERAPFLKKINRLQIRNYLRFGMLYLDDNDIIYLLKYWEQLGTTDFGPALNDLNNQEIYTRRTYLRQHLKHDLRWFLQFFNLKSRVA